MDNETKSIVLNLETLQAEYETVLLQYRQVQTDYMNSVKEQLNSPCRGSSKGVSQSCLDDIWHKAGCITKPPNATDSWQEQQTLDTLITDVFNWSTMTDDEHRKGCYNTTDVNYDKYNTATSPSYNVKKLTEIKGQSFWGTTSVGEGAVSSIEECKSMCLNKPTCTGATYNPDKKYCWTRGGDGKPIPALENDYAIIPETTKYMNLLQVLNQRLTSINQEILTIVKTNEPLYESQVKEREKQMSTLNNNVQMLNDERKQIMTQLQTRGDLNEAHTQSSITTTRYYSLYMLFFFITILMVVLFMGSSFTILPFNDFSYNLFIVFVVTTLSLMVYHFAKK